MQNDSPIVYSTILPKGLSLYYNGGRAGKFREGINIIPLLALSLGVDAFAVAASCGMSVPDFRRKQALLLAFYFGIFQAGMTAIGAFVGHHFSARADQAGRIVAFTLLTIVGGRMVWEALRKDKKEQEVKSLSQTRMLILSVATSIDALAAGISLGLTSGSLVLACVTIGAAAFAMTLIGGFLGGRVGGKFHDQAGLGTDWTRCGEFALIGGLGGTRVLSDFVFLFGFRGLLYLLG